MARAARSGADQAHEQATDRQARRPDGSCTSVGRSDAHQHRRHELEEAVLHLGESSRVRLAIARVAQDFLPHRVAPDTLPDTGGSTVEGLDTEQLWRGSSRLECGDGISCRVIRNLRNRGRSDGVYAGSATSCDKLAKRGAHVDRSPRSVRRMITLPARGERSARLMKTVGRRPTPGHGRF